MRIERAKLSDIVFDDQNANLGTERGEYLLGESLQKHGAGRGVLLDKNRRLIAGNKVTAKAGELGVAEEVVIVHTKGNVLVATQRDDLDLDTPEGRALALFDNRVGEANLEWDPKVLLALSEQGVPVEEMWHEDEWRELLAQAQSEGGGASEDPGAQVDCAEELREKWQTAAGQLWLIPCKSVPGREHRLLCGDSTSAEDVGRLMEGEKANCVWTDPPYGVGYVGKTRDALTIDNDSREGLIALIHASIYVAAAQMAEGASFYIAAPAGPQLFDFAVAIRASGLTWRQSLVWVKDSMVLGHSDYHYRHEVIFYGSKGRRAKFYGGRKQTSVLGNNGVADLRQLSEDSWQLQVGGDIYLLRGQNVTIEPVYTDALFVDRPTRSELHPTTKPVELVAQMVANSTERGALVYDPFSGSGTTLVACEQLGRRGRAVELEPKYVAVTLERLSQMGLEPRLAE